jgi:hypothetical protein
MNAIPNIKEAELCKEAEPFLKTSAAEEDRLFPVPECTRTSLREAVDTLLGKAHELADRAHAKRDIYLCRAVDKAIEQVHEVADVLGALEYQLTEAAQETKLRRSGPETFGAATATGRF